MTHSIMFWEMAAEPPRRAGDDNDASRPAGRRAGRRALAPRARVCRPPRRRRRRRRRRRPARRSPGRSRGRRAPPPPSARFGQCRLGSSEEARWRRKVSPGLASVNMLGATSAAEIDSRRARLGRRGGGVAHDRGRRAAAAVDAPLPRSCGWASGTTTSTSRRRATSAYRCAISPTTAPRRWPTPHLRSSSASSAARSPPRRDWRRATPCKARRHRRVRRRRAAARARRHPRARRPWADRDGDGGAREGVRLRRRLLRPVPRRWRRQGAGRRRAASLGELAAEEVACLSLHCNATRRPPASSTPRSSRSCRRARSSSTSARGELVDETALAAALGSGHLAAAALDVHASEPFRAGEGPLAGAPNLHCTPHLGWYSPEARLEMRQKGAAAARRACEGRGSATLSTRSTSGCARSSTCTAASIRRAPRAGADEF